MTQTLSTMVHDIRNGRATPFTHTPLNPKLATKMAAWVSTEYTPPLIDATGVFDALPEQFDDAREQFPCVKPPWQVAWIGYRDPAGIQDSHFACLTISFPIGGLPPFQSQRPYPPETTEVIYIFVWMAGTSIQGVKYRAIGPLLFSEVPINETGAIVEVRVYENELMDAVKGDWSRWTVLGTYNLLNCRNIELQPKPQTRQERRRHDRQGITTVESVLHIKPTGTRRPHNPITGAEASTRLHSVRGHVAHYGNCCPGRHEPRGLLFGQQTGRIWVPQHARGDIENGQTHQTFILETSDT